MYITANDDQFYTFASAHRSFPPLEITGPVRSIATVRATNGLHLNPNSDERRLRNTVL